jgi:arabinogalactan endo-1,4-beta-galactosidase
MPPPTVRSRRRALVLLTSLTLAATTLVASPASAAPGWFPGPAAHGGSGGGALSVRGADISFTPQLEAAGVKFSDRGKVRPADQILASHGANYVRLRVWTNPPAGYSDEASALALAKRAKRLGMKILLDLHYSDFWADPQHEDTPAAWVGQDLPTLANTVRTYTRKVLADFARQGTPVDMFQVGNEVRNGFLWPVGELYPASGGERWAEFSTLLKAGIAGAREGSPRWHQPRIMIHIDKGGDNGASRYFFDHILAQGVQFDIIGQSYYAMWHGSLADLQNNSNDLATRYHKDLVIVETQYPWTLENGDQLSDFVWTPSQLPDGALYPATPAGQAGYYEAIRKILAQVPERRGLGFFVWEPEWIPGVGWAPGEGNPNDNMTMFDWTGKALPSLAVFRPPSNRR